MSISDVMEFVFYECFYLIPHEVVQAFESSATFELLKASIIQHLELSTSIRLAFEEKYNQTNQKNWTKLLMHYEIPDGAYNKQFKQLESFYSNKYYSVVRTKGKPLNFCSFQENLYLHKIQNLSNDPLYGNRKVDYEQINKCVNFLKSEKVKPDHLTHYLIESKYHVDLMIKLIDHIKKEGTLTIPQLKSWSLFSLLPNVITRSTFIEPLYTYSRKYAEKASPLNAIKYVANIIEHTPNKEGELRRSTINNFREQHFIDDFLKKGFSSHMEQFYEEQQHSHLTRWIINLATFTFPILEMYAYYLVKERFHQLRSLNSEDLLKKMNVQYLSDISIDKIPIFNAISPVIYNILKVQFSFELPLNDNEIKYVYTKLQRNRTLHKTYINHNFLNSIAFTDQLAKIIYSKTTADIDSAFYQVINTDAVVRAHENARSCLIQ